jgi:ABC-2 type transport system permease protein
MRLSKSWIIASKDFKVFMKKKNIIYSTVIIPFIVSFLFPVVVEYALKEDASRMRPEVLTVLLPTFAFFYLILAGVTPTSIASYTIIGEKVEKSLERLLSTPTTDGEILLGKGIAAFLPTIACLLGGATIYMVLMDLVTRGTLGYYFFPNWDAGILLFLMVPLGVILSVEWNVVVSARVSDVRVAQQIGLVMLLPFVGIYVLGENNLVPLGVTNNLLIIAGILGAVDALLLYVAKATFRREEILTKWK